MGMACMKFLSSLSRHFSRWRKVPKWRLPTNCPTLRVESLEPRALLDGTSFLANSLPDSPATDAGDLALAPVSLGHPPATDRRGPDRIPDGENAGIPRIAPGDVQGIDPRSANNDGDQSAAQADTIVSELVVRQTTNVRDRTNSLIAALDHGLSLVEDKINQILDLMAESSLLSLQNIDQTAQTQLRIDSLLESIRRVSQTVRFQGMTLLDGRLGVNHGGVLLDLEHYDETIQPVRLYVPSTSTLGGDSGRLFELGSGRGKSLAIDAQGAVVVALETLHEVRSLREYIGGYASYYGGDTVLVSDPDLGGHRLVEIHSDVPLPFARLAEADAVTLSPEGDYVYVGGLEDGSTALFQWGRERKTLTFLELLRVSTALRENPLLAEAADGAAEIQSLIGEIGSILSDAESVGGPNGSVGTREQTRIDGLLDSIDDIARSTTFEDVTLLDGNIDFLITPTANFDRVTDLQVYQADLGVSGSMDVEIDIISIATQAQTTATIPYSQPATPSLTGDLVFELSGVDGAEVFLFGSGATGDELEAAINLASDATGVTASMNGTTLTLTSTACGSAAFVQVNVIMDAGNFEHFLSETRAMGTDVAATVNGMRTVGRGNTLSINTAVLDMTATVAVASIDAVTFAIAGGARYVAGVEDDPRQQTRLGIRRLTTDSLGTPTGRLGDLHSDSSASPAVDLTGAMSIVVEAAADVARMSVRLDAWARGESAVSVVIVSASTESIVVSPNPRVVPSERTTPILARADEGLSRLTVLLNELRELVVSVATDGLNLEQLDHRQLEVDMLLQAIDRVAKFTSLDDAAPLDGHLQMTTTGETAAWLRHLVIGHANFNPVADPQVDQLPPGVSDSMAVDINVSEAATRASLAGTVIDARPAAAATVEIDFADGDHITLTAHPPGAAANGIAIDFVETASVAAGSVIATYDEANAVVTVRVNDTADTAMANIATALRNLTPIVTALYAENGAGDTDFSPSSEQVTQRLLSGGSDAVFGLPGDLIFELGGTQGVEVFNFHTGTTGQQMEAAINLVGHATGVMASYSANTLTFMSSEYGSAAHIAVDVIRDDGGFAASLSAMQARGSDVVASVGGVAAVGRGNTLSIDTPTLNLIATITAGATGNTSSTFAGGASLSQIDPHSATHQQIHIGIGSMNSAHLGGPIGPIDLLRFGNREALSFGPTRALEIVEGGLTAVTQQRGRLATSERRFLGHVQPFATTPSVVCTLTVAPTWGLDPTTGEISILPENLAEMDEWSSFFVEIWVGNPGGSVAQGSLELTYNTNYFTATNVEYGPAMTGEQTDPIDDTTGRVFLDAFTAAVDVGDDKVALFARVAFVPTADDGVAINSQASPLRPVNDLGLALENLRFDLPGARSGDLVVAEMPTTQLWPVPYDLDDSGQIGFGDLAYFASVFLHSVDDAGVPLAWGADFDCSGRVDFADLAWFAPNFGRAKSDGAGPLVYPPSRSDGRAPEPLGFKSATAMPARSPTAISFGQLFPVVDEALSRTEGIREQHAAGVLHDVTFEITDLPGDLLGRAMGTSVIQIDVNAAGHGWFVDPTPADDREFRPTWGRGEMFALSHSPAHTRVDLLTVVLHELGHVIGHDHSDEGVMEKSIPLGTRRVWDDESLNDPEGLGGLLNAQDPVSTAIDDCFAT